MDKEIFAYHLETQFLGKQAIILDEVDSTNTYLKEHCQRLEDGAFVYARCQNAGKGRLTRSWASREGDGIAMSFLLKKVELDEMKLLSVMAGLGVYHALRRIYSEDCFAIKWPNDVLAGEKKICGILCESKYDGQVADVVCGIGINVAQQQDFFDENGLPFATSLQLAAGKQVRQEIIAAGVLGEIEKTLGMYRDGKWPEILAQYRKSCINLGREVVVTQGDQAIEGVAEDLDEDGALVVRADGKLHHIHAGEAHVRGLYGYV